MDPEHKAAKSNLDLVSYLGRVSYREILSSLRNREHDHAVDLIEASIQKGEDPDRLLRGIGLKLSRILWASHGPFDRTQILVSMIIRKCAFLDTRR